MASPPTSDLASDPHSDPPADDVELQALRIAVRGAGRRPGLVDVLPRLQRSHRKMLVRHEMWTKGELARHPEPREVIRSMRRPGNVDERRRVVQTFDARRTMVADVHENRVVRYTVEEIMTRLIIRSREGNAEAGELLHELDHAVSTAPFLHEVGGLRSRPTEPTATLSGDPLYRTVFHALIGLPR
jgi:predicted component of viral defense system (DUF524 family)